MHVYGIVFIVYLPTWQPLHLLVQNQIPGGNKRIRNPPPKVLAAGFFPKIRKKEIRHSKEPSRHTLAK